MAIKIEACQPHHHKSPHTKHKMSSTSALKQITALLPQLSFRDGLMLLRLITLDLTMSKESSAAFSASASASASASEAKEAKEAKEAAPKEAKEAKPQEAAAPAPKVPKKASGGTMAWMGFVKHCQETQPTRFADSKDRGHVLSVAKEIRHEDEDAYKSFVAEWQTDDEAASSSETEAASLAAQTKAKKAKKAAAPKEAEGTEADATQPKAKRPANPAILAFTSYSRHLMEAQPELFTEAKSHGEKLKIVSQFSKDNKEAYETFVAQWKTAHKVSSAANYLKASPLFVPGPMVGGGGSVAASLKED